MGTCSEPSHGALRRQAAAALCALLLLGGCDSVAQFYDSKLSLDNPIDWWHQMEGGELAEQRPPPPGVADPYPNLGSIPARPTPTDPATRHALLAQLASQRDRTKLLAAQDPVAWPVPDAPRPPTAAPAPAAVAAAPAVPAAPPRPSARSVPATPPVPPAAAASAPDPDSSTLVLDAADATPSTPVVTPAAAPDPHPPAAFTAPPRAGAPATGPVPALPEAAPALPTLRGLPTADPAPVATRARPSAHWSFPPGSAALPASAEAALRALAARRADGPIAVSAGGEARSSDPAAQARALPLALQRTGAITAALVAAGIPAGAIRAEAVAPGREASARLVD